MSDTRASWHDRLDVDLDPSTDGVVEVCFTGRGVPGSEPTAARGAAVRSVVPPELDAAWAHQVHGADVADVAGRRDGECGEADALVSDRTDLGLGVVTADCVPVLLTDGRQIAAVHAGWRGVVAKVVDATVDRFDSAPTVAWIGPAISGEVYEVGDEVADQVVAVSAPEVAHLGPRGRAHVDLRRAVALQLAARGVDDVRMIGPCTFSTPGLWSHRRESRAGLKAGRNVSAIWRTIGRTTGRRDV
ncbi:MAG: peptidoglycan editing factor PgeF [Acidobacteriota bacterium]